MLSTLQSTVSTIGAMFNSNMPFASDLNLEKSEALSFGKEYIIVILTLSQTTNFLIFLTERVCRQQILNLTKWQKVFQKSFENTMGKGEIAHYEQFLLFPQCFQKTCTADM